MAGPLKRFAVTATRSPAEGAKSVDLAWPMSVIHRYLRVAQCHFREHHPAEFVQAPWSGGASAPDRAPSHVRAAADRVHPRCYLAPMKPRQAVCRGSAMADMRTSLVLTMLSSRWRQVKGEDRILKASARSGASREYEHPQL